LERLLHGFSDGSGKVLYSRWIFRTCVEWTLLQLKVKV
jgi:hypothetical protein